MIDRMDELNELIVAGWGHVPNHKIPANWKDLEPPRIPPSGCCWGEGYKDPDKPVRRKVRRPKGERVDTNQQWMKNRQAAEKIACAGEEVM